MNSLPTIIGQRLRAYRCHRGLTQERLAELAEVHPTYIGQVERGEKNLTLTTLHRLLRALDVSFVVFFECIDPRPSEERSYAQRCYELVSGRSEKDQQRLYTILREIDRLGE